MTMSKNPDRSQVLLRANVYDAQTSAMTPERNIRNVRVIYVADLPEDKNTKIVVLEAEMWDYKEMIWRDIFGDLAVVMPEGAVISPDQPIEIPFPALSQVEWSTNRYDRLFHIHHREDKYNAG